MAKATIQSSTGAVITIEGTQSEVSGDALDLRAEHNRDKHKRHHREATRAEKGCEETVQRDDWRRNSDEHGFFAKPKTLAQISDALEEQGFLYPVTTLSGVVLGLVKKKHLRRKKIDGKVDLWKVIATER